MADHFALITSPIKDTKKAAGSRKEMTALEVREEYMEPCGSFFSDHLNVPADTDFRKLLEADATLVTLVESYVSAGEKTQYSAFCNVLNHLSKKLCGGNEIIVFVDHHTANLKSHPNGYFDCSPDVIGVLESRFSTYPPTTPCKCAEWADPEAVVEIKNENDYLNGIGQLAAYLGLANQSRPDKVGLYGLVASPRGYQIQYSDAGGLTTSSFSDWENLVPLASYVYTLYFPIPGRPHCDPTITRSTIRTADKPTWDITFNGETYPACEVKFVGQPWKRMTWVAQTAGKYPTVIKDSYWACGRTFKEGELYDLLQSDGNPAPGFVAVIAHGDIFSETGPITSVNIDPHVYRIKTRIIMGTSGDPLAKTSSIRRFLMAMYDVLEAHRWAVQERNIIHRDISPGNILINPKDRKDLEKEDLKESTRPIFVLEVLTQTKYAPPMARLYDFDNSAEYDRLRAKTAAFKESLKRSPEHEHFRHRTGTPRFMARAVAAGHSLDKCGVWDFFKPMPSLESNPYGPEYRQAHSIGNNSLRLFEDGEDTRHGGRGYITTSDIPKYDNYGYAADGPSVTELRIHRPRVRLYETRMSESREDECDDDKSANDESTDDDSPEEKFDITNAGPIRLQPAPKIPTEEKAAEQVQIFRHLPRHDAESVFWVIVVFLLRALPRNQSPKEDANVRFLAKAWHCIESHEIESGLPTDSRNELLIFKAAWQQYLHPQLVGLVPMMHELIEQISPEYNHLSEPPPNDFHLHEAMQRILLKYIAAFAGKSDIPLNTKEGRIILRPEDPPVYRVSTEISLDGQHLQRAGHRSRFLVGSDGIVKDKRKRRDSVDANSSDGPFLPPLPRFPDLPRTFQHHETAFLEGASNVAPEETIFKEKRRRMQ